MFVIDYTFRRKDLMIEYKKQYLIYSLIIFLLFCISEQVLFVAHERESDSFSLCDIDQ